MPAGMKFIDRLLLKAQRRIYSLWRKRNLRRVNPRLWSNDELAKFAALFTGDVINVSGGRDADKEGGCYREYFKNAASYSLSNYVPEFTGSELCREIELDLSRPLAPASPLAGGYDVVFTHTVLEHIYEVQQAVANLCRMSRDVVISVVPFLQEFHHVPDQYHDYWRISPYALARLFQQNGFTTLHVNWNEDPLGNIYVFHIASRQPGNWTGRIAPLAREFAPGAARLWIHPEQDGSMGSTRVDPGDLYPQE